LNLSGSGTMTNNNEVLTVNKVLTADGTETGLYTNLLYNIRNQNYDGAEWGNTNYLVYKQKVYAAGHHHAEISTKSINANWFFQDTGKKLGDNPLYNIRNQNYDGGAWNNANYLNYENEDWMTNHHYTEISTKNDNANWFFQDTGEKLGKYPL